MAETRLVADLVFDARTAGAEGQFTYTAAAGMALGQAWIAPLGTRRAVGWVLALRTVTEAEMGFSFERLREPSRRVHGLELPAKLIDLVLDVADQCLTPPSMAMSVAAPPGISERLATTWEALDLPDDREHHPLSAAQEEALRVLHEGPLVEHKGRPIPAGVKKALRLLELKGFARQMMALRPIHESARPSGLLRLTSNEAKIEKFLSKEGRRRPAQAMTLLRLQGSEMASFAWQEIKALGGVTDQTIKSLIQAGLLEEADGAAVRRALPEPNPSQQAAIAAIASAVSARSAKGFLLYGVTGSGKTEVYLRAASEALKWGRQVLYLVPEIALTAQVIAQLRERFGRSVAVLHSNMNPTERLESWMRVQTGEAPVVLGPRSALFAPLASIGLIIVDEEHEASYKQENSPRYHSRRVVESLARLHACPFVLGSATPSLESYWEAGRGMLELLELPQRAASARLPEVFIEDLGEGYREKKPAILTPPLHQALQETLEAGQQSILFLNRRAFAKFLICRTCGWRWTCEACAVALSYHKRENKLKCHHCDHIETAPESCPQCGGDQIRPFGVGSEKVEEEVARLFPEARVARLDRDIARRKGALEEIFTKFRGGDIDVLVGTQMVAKGLDFPNVTLVGVIAADITLNVPDFRASERTFQLLSQVAGRAGRGRHPGRVIIQTLNPSHPSVTAAQAHDYLALYNSLIGERKEAKYPPFVRLINVLVAGPDLQRVASVSALAAQKLRKALPSAEVVGPADCAMEKLQNAWRRHVVVKLDPLADYTLVSQALAGLDDGKTRVSVDIDPSSLL